MVQSLHEQWEPVGAALLSLATDVVPLKCVDYETVAEYFRLLAPLSVVPQEKKVCPFKVIPNFQMIKHKNWEKNPHPSHIC